MTMSPQKKQLPDRSRQRREYLWNRTSIDSRAAVIVLWSVCAHLGTVFCGITAITLLSKAPAAPLCWFVAAITAWFAWCMGRASRNTYTALQEIGKEASMLRYVPPVREQFADLPAEEVLLRGSEEGAAQQGELLRAADASPVSKSEELLRAMNKAHE
jgi:hypothetical protein